MVLLLSAPARDEVVDQLHGRVVHLDVEGFDLVREIVIRPHRRDGDEKTESGGDKGFGNTAGHSRETGGFAAGDTFEGVDDADDGAEEADEGSRRADGGEAGEAALHFGMDNGDGALETAARRFDDFFIADLSGSRLEFGEASGDDLGNVA